MDFCKKMRHPFHLVEPSPWPLLVSINLLYFVISLIGYINGFLYAKLSIIIIIITLISGIILWFIDIYTESLYMGYHSIKVSKGLILGFILFVLTEIMLFFSFFWAYFHSASSLIDLIWPPIGIDLINPFSIPLLNTLLLLYSGIIATYGHHNYLNNNRLYALLGLGIGIFLGLIFLYFQYFEYSNSTFDITDSVYSSSFFLLTGTHGFHVIVGVLLLIIVFIRIYNYNHPTIYFDLSLIYYHFIDIVWIALFILIYYLAGSAAY